MLPPPKPTLLALGLVLCLTGCSSDTGNECHADYQCYSDSCTWGTCDSPLVEALLGDDDDEYDSAPPTTRQPAPSPAEAQDPKPNDSGRPLGGCDYLPEVLCRAEAECQVVQECGISAFCQGVECALSDCDVTGTASACEAPCEVLATCEARR